MIYLVSYSILKNHKNNNNKSVNAVQFKKTWSEPTRRLCVLVAEVDLSRITMNNGAGSRLRWAKIQETYALL